MSMPSSLSGPMPSSLPGPMTGSLPGPRPGPASDAPRAHQTPGRVGRFVARLSILLLVVAMAACVPDQPADVEMPDDVTSVDDLPRLQVIHTNDFHGRLDPQVVDGDSLGGSAWLAAHFDSLRVDFDGPTVVVSAGDVMQGTAISNLSWGAAAIDVYNLKGYDAAALGNHEFDWGLDTLQARVAESDFVWLGANVLDEETGEHPGWVRPWTVVERDDVRVGIVGVALSTTPEVVMAGRTDGVRFEDEAAAIDVAVREVREEDVDFVIVTGHVGATCEEPGQGPEELSAGCAGLAIQILEALEEPIDLFLAGHTHLRNLTEAGGVPLVQNPAYSRTISVTRLQHAGGERAEATHRELRVPYHADVDPDVRVLQAVEMWGEEVRPRLEEVVTVFADSLTNEDRAPVENPAGNLLADAQRWATEADVGLVNNGSLRRSLPAGEVTWEVLFEFQPFQNDLVVLELDGALLRDAVEFGLTDDGRPWTHWAGIRIEYDPEAPRGERVLRIEREDGSVVEDDDVVTVGTTEFVALGGDGYELLTQAEVRYMGRTDVDGLRDYLAGLETPVAPPATDRWVEVDGSGG
ncbi:MAG: bifunctional metallophosphatase/5'-nucleotidase [Gemmatimonadales bacterium]|nr:MAG: bifunctional metallophosphatase/5'-nucleotidase [Gemmatimonadales bacterium]